MNKPLIGVVVLALSFAASAEIKLATGSCTDASGKGGATYCALASDMQKFCGRQVTLDVQPSKGSFDNVQGMLRNEYSAGIVQFDVMRYFADKDKGMAHLKVLFPLHIEEIHIVALNEPPKEGGVFGIWAKSVALQTIKDLGGRKVVAWGGSALSAEYFAFKAKLDYQVIDISDKPDPERIAAKMLADGKAHAIFAVGGQPIGWLDNEKLFGKQFKLLSITTDVADQVGSTYDPVTLNYANLSNGQVPSLGVQALLVTQDFRTEDRAKALMALKQCVIANTDKMRDMLGTHPKWKFIDATMAFDRWPSYQSPYATETTTPVTSTSTSGRAVDAIVSSDAPPKMTGNKRR